MGDLMGILVFLLIFGIPIALIGYMLKEMFLSKDDGKEVHKFEDKKSFFQFQSKINGIPLSEYKHEEAKQVDKLKSREVINKSVCRCPNCGEIADVKMSKKAGLFGGGAGILAIGSGISSAWGYSAGMGIFLKIITFGLIGAGAVMLILMPFVLVIGLLIYLGVRLIAKPLIRHEVTCPHCHKKYLLNEQELSDLWL